jgi:hypothetical protein
VRRRSRPCGTRLVPVRRSVEKGLRHLRAARVLDADEEDPRYFGTASSL